MGVDNAACTGCLSRTTTTKAQDTQAISTTITAIDILLVYIVVSQGLPLICPVCFDLGPFWAVVSEAWHKVPVER